MIVCWSLVLWPAAAWPTEPANPNATAEARQILAYFYSLPKRMDKRVLSGQTGGWADHVARDYKQCVEQLHEQTGKWVAMVAFDYIGFTPEVNKYAQKAWKDGSLVMISWHANNPWTGKSYSDRQIGSGLREAITVGTEANKRWLAMLDTTAERLKELAANNGVVLWRPFHEMNSSGFWWCRRDKADFVALWRHMFDYFTNVKKLNHLLWVYSPDDGYGDEFSGLHYFPGDAYVDIVGLDKYGIGKKLVLKHYQELVSTGKPFGLTEVGPSGKEADNRVLIEAVRKDYPKTLFFVHWTGRFAIVSHPHARELLTDPWVVNRDDLDWRRAAVK